MINLKNILILDIETVSSEESFEELNERMQKQWERKASFLKNEDELSAAEMFSDRAAIYAEFGKVVSIGVGLFTQSEAQGTGLRIKSFTSENEIQILEEFKDLVNVKLKGKDLILCAHNGKEFDFPYLCRRYLVNGIEIPSVLQISGKKPWEINHIDTMELWKFGDRKNFTSLDLLASLFNIESSKGNMDGSMVSEVYYKENDLDKIAEYCKQDILVTANLYLKMNLMDPVPENNVSIAD